MGVMDVLRPLVLISGATVGLATFAAPAVAATTGHAQTVNVVCSSSGFTTDGNALQGQITEVTQFYAVSGIACKLYDGNGALLYDPSA